MNPSLEISDSGDGSSGDMAVFDDRYEALVQQLPDALYVLQDGCFVFINPAGVKLFRARHSDQLLGSRQSDFLHPDFQPAVQSGVLQMFKSSQTVPLMEQRYVCCDGSLIDVEVCSTPFLYEGMAAIQVIARDVTVQKTVGAALRESEDRHRQLAHKANQAKESLQYEKKILEMIALDRPLPAILNEVCWWVEKVLSGHPRCSIILLDPDGVHVRVGAAPSLPVAYHHAIHGLPIGPAAGSCGTAIYRNEQIIVADIARDSRWGAYRAAALPHGLRACWSTPITVASGAVLGAFGVYYGEPATPSAEDQAFIWAITHLVGVAIHKHRVERSLEESEERYRAMVVAMAEGIMVQARDGTILTCNPSAERILRTGPNQLAGQIRGNYCKRVLNEDGMEIPSSQLPSEIVLRTGQPLVDLVIGMEVADGDIVWMSENILPIRRPGESEVSSVLISFTDISAVKEAQQRLLFSANHDALTGLPNRSCLAERLASSLPKIRRNDLRAAILFLDLDRFKNVNDTIGHEAGDRLLQTVAVRLASCIREADMLARLGGDEFVILVENFDDASYLSTLAERIVQVISEPFHLEGNDYYLGVSIGVSIFPDDGDDGPTLLRSADSAMYFAKERGRNQHQFYTSELSARAQRRYAIEKNLRRALLQNEFFLLYQPKIALRSGRIVGVEALVRWQSADHGVIEPNDFIPIAEDTGLIVPIGQWVLEQACRQAAQWQQLMPDLRMAVNFSPRQFQDDTLVKQIGATLQSTALAPDALVVEITESLLMGDSTKLTPVFEALLALGVGISIDDFGTGYSSLSYLQRFPIDNIKIDRSFIDGIPGNRDSVALTQAIIAMAHALEMSVTAEGVELESQMRFLKDAGCDEMQGLFQ
ncbi:EAL domain-containing protein [Undibacterium arcticum]|uniref:EAL domain-containing protein n=1 Tax=Undibacterium arcticum TaxID=1762892 RepID=UPI00360E705F